MITCKDVGVELCLGCRNILTYNKTESGCWMIFYERSLNTQSNETIIEHFFNVVKRYSISDPDMLKCYYEAIKIKKPHLVEKLDKLMILI